MAGYTEGFTSVDGEVITVNLFEQEYTAIEAAFDNSTGHTHDGTVGNGAYIPVIADTADLNEVRINGIGDEIVFSINDTGVKTSQLTIVDGAILPTLTNDIDLGSSGARIKDVYVAGTSNLAILALASGVVVSSILDDDTLTANSDTALVTQQSVKAYVDNKVHTSISTADGLNVVEVDGVTDTIIFSTDVASVKTNQLKVDGSAVYPHTNLGLNLGIDNTNEFNEIHGETIHTNNLTLTGFNVTDIYDEDSLGSNSDVALATQQSIKAYVDNTVSPINSSISTIEAGNGTVVRTNSIPANAKGVAGHTAGMVRADANFVYICHTTWTDGVADIWSRAAIAGGF